MATSDLALEPTRCLLCSADDPAPVVETPTHLGPDRGARFRFVRCSACDLVYLNPRPTPEALSAFYGPSYLPHRGPEAWGRWSRLVEAAGRRRDRARVDRALDALEVVRRARPGRDPVTARPGPRESEEHDGAVADPGTLRALDVGCGVPTFLARLRRRTGADCTGVDTSDRGWRDRPALARGLDLRTGRVSEVDLEPGFDLVTLWHVLEHVPEPRLFLERLRERASANAALVVEVPDHASPVRRLQGASWIGYDAPRHTAAYEPRTLRGLLEAAGWHVVRLRRKGTLDPWVLWWLGRQVARGRTLEGSLEGRFPGFLLGKVLTWPVAALEGWIPLGAMTAVARPRASDDA